MAENKPELKPGDRLGRYTVLKELGRGRSGVVYLAEQAVLRRKVVINLLHAPAEAMAEYLGRMAELMAKVDHPSIVSLLDAGEHEGCPYLVAEYVEGQSLAQLAQEGEMTALPVLLRIVAAVCGGLQHAHEKGAVYQVLSPENIVVGPSGQPVLVDLGLDRLFAGVLEGIALAMPGRQSLRVAPERISAQRPSPQTDIWAAGQLLYEVIAHCLPYKSPSAIASCDPVNLSPLAGKAPDFVIEIVGRCLEKDPAKRFPSADALRRALEAAVDRLETSQGETLELPPPRQGQTLLLHVEYQEADLPGAYRQYEIDRYLGGGNYGDVFRAKELLSGKAVALKILKREWVANADAVARFRREATLLARLAHPNIVRVHNFGRYEPSFFIAMDLLEGPTLHEVMAKRGPFSVNDLISFVVQVGSGLAAVHELGAVHRDLKPANIKMVGDRFVVFDFGMAYVEDAAKLTMTGATVGSPAYMSPEQASYLPVTSASDVYALGVILYEMLSGKLPHKAGSQNELMEKIVAEPPAPITEHRADLPPPVVETLVSMLAKNPAERPSAARVRQFFARSSWHGSA